MSTDKKTNELMVFENDTFGKIEIIIDDDGNELFKAKSIALILGYKDTDQAIRKHCKRTKIRPVFSTGQIRYMAFIPEGDVYRLIVRSKLPAAEKFESWVFEEVLPTIRKTGGYVQEGRAKEFVDMWLPNLDDVHKEVIANVLEENRKMRVENKSMKPKAEYYDALVDTKTLTNIRDTAKELKIGQKRFVLWLLEKKYVYRNQQGKLMPYMKYVNNHEYFQVKEWTDKKKKGGVQTLITVKGRDAFRKRLEKEGLIKKQIVELSK